MIKYTVSLRDQLLLPREVHPALSADKAVDKPIQNQVSQAAQHKETASARQEEAVTLEYNSKLPFS